MTFDPLDSVLGRARVEDARFVRIEARAPWGISFPVRDVARLVFMSGGGSELTGTGLGAPVRFADGACLLARAGAVFTLRDSPGGALLDCDALAKTRFGTATIDGPGAKSTILSSRFAVDPVAANVVFSALPALSLLDMDTAAGRLVRETFSLLSAERDAALMGVDTIGSRLSEVLFVQALRALRPAAADAAAGWLGAFAEPRLSSTMEQLHDDLGHPWSIEELAGRAGMSRSRFIALFKIATGDTPSHYLAVWRVHEAKRLLRETDMSVAQVAHAVGYASGQSLSRVFAKETGTAPAHWRRGAAPRDGQRL